MKKRIVTNNSDSLFKIQVSMRGGSVSSSCATFQDEHDIYINLHLNLITEYDNFEKVTLNFDMNGTITGDKKVYVIPMEGYNFYGNNLPNGMSEDYIDCVNLAGEGVRKISFDITSFVRDMVVKKSPNALVRLHTVNGNQGISTRLDFSGFHLLETEILSATLIQIDERGIDRSSLELNYLNKGNLYITLKNKNIFIETPRVLTNNKKNPFSFSIGQVRSQGGLFPLLSDIDRCSFEYFINRVYDSDEKNIRIEIYDYLDLRHSYFLVEELENKKTFTSLDGSEILEEVVESEKYFFTITKYNGEMILLEQVLKNSNDYKITKKVNVDGSILEYEWDFLKLVNVYSRKNALSERIHEVVLEYSFNNGRYTLVNVIFLNEKKVVQINFPEEISESNSLFSKMLEYKVSRFSNYYTFVDGTTFLDLCANCVEHLKYYRISEYANTTDDVEKLLIYDLKSKQGFLILKNNETITIKEALLNENPELTEIQNCNNFLNLEKGKITEIYNENDNILVKTENNNIIEYAYNYLGELLYTAKYVLDGENKKYVDYTSNKVAILRDGKTTILNKGIYLNGSNRIKNGQFDNQFEDWTVSNSNNVSIINNNEISHIVGENAVELNPSAYISQEIDIKGSWNEDLYFSLFMKGNLNSNNRLKIELKVKYEHDNTNWLINDYNKEETYSFEIGENCTGLNNILSYKYQKIVGSIINKYNYCKVEIKILNDSAFPIIVSNIALYSGKTLRYSENNALHEKLSNIVYGDNSVDYTYDEKERVKTIRSNEGIYDLLYDENIDFYSPSIIRKRGTDEEITYELKNISDVSSRLMSTPEKVVEEKIKINASNVKSSLYCYDEKERIKEVVNHKNMRSVYLYDAFNNLYNETKYDKTSRLYDIAYTFDYGCDYPFDYDFPPDKGIVKSFKVGRQVADLTYENMNITSIGSSNFLYNFSYDPAANVTATSFGNNNSLVPINELEYKNINLYPSGYITKEKEYTGMNKYVEKNIVYNDNNLINEIIENSSTGTNKTIKYIYDENKAKLLEVLLDNRNIKTYNYDNNNRIVEYVNNEYQDVELVEKYNYNNNEITDVINLINNEKKSHYYNYPQNNKNYLGYLLNMSGLLLNDYFIFDNNNFSSYSDEPALTNTSIIVNADTRMKMINFSDANSSFEYEIGNLNKNRYNNAYYNNKLYESNIESDLLKKSLSTTLIYRSNSGIKWMPIEFLSENGDILYEINLFDEKIGKNISGIKEILISKNSTTSGLENDQWHVLTFSLSTSKATIFVDDEILFTATLREESSRIEEIKKIRMRTPNITSTEGLEDVQIIYLNIGPHTFTDIQLISLYKNSINYLNNEPKNNLSGVSYYNNNVYQKFEMFNLNSSLLSDTGKIPYRYIYSNYKYKTSLDNIFKHDTTLNKKTYFSYDEKYNIDGSIMKSVLSYKLTLPTEGTITIRFKPIEGSNSMKSVISIVGQTHSFGIKVNEDGVMNASIDGSYYVLDNKAEFGNWNTLFMVYKSNGLYYKINNYPLTLIKSFNVTQANESSIHIGCDINSVDEPINQLNGYIEMWGYSYEFLTEEEMNNIYEEDGLNHVHYKYDEDNRIIEKEIKTNKNIFKTKYRYTNKDENLISSEINSKGQETIYEYDNSNRIIKTATISKGNVDISELKFVSGNAYEYDVYGNLRKELYYEGNTDTLIYQKEYVYDPRGNIIQKIENEDIYRFTYDSQVRLTSVIINDVIIKNITYDGLYPITISNNEETKNLTWENNRLIQYGNIEYTYDIDGNRTSKNVNGVITKYVIVNDKIIRTIKNDVILDYHYDEKNQVVGFSYNNNEYFYTRDILGNIKNIIDSSGNIMVSYKYDSYGNVTISNSNSSLKNILAENNIFLYKGYVYDVETQLYWVSSRYYSPELCRWISTDSIEYLDPESINGLNLYCYCYNNPIMYADPSGHSPEWWQWLLVGVGAALVIGAVTVLTCGVGTSVMVGTLAGSMLHGAAIGTLIGAGVGAAGGAIIGGAINDWSAEGIVEGMMIGFGGGAIAGAIIGATVGGIHYGWQQNVLTKANSFSSYPGEKTELHHIVEQCQIKKSGFSSKLIRNSNNEVRIAKSLHSKISSYYSSLYKGTGMRFRNYLAANHYSLGSQYNTGIKVINMMLKGMI